MEKPKQETIDELYKFLQKNDPKKQIKAFDVATDKIPAFAKKQVDSQIEIYNTIFRDTKFMEILGTFAKSYAERFALTPDKVMPIVLAILVHLIFIKKINITNIKESI